MFGRKDQGQDGAAQQETTSTSPVVRASVAESIRSTSPSSPISSPASRRNHHDAPGGNSGRRERPGESGERKLTVGRGLSVNGEITACDVLVVEGKVEAKLADGKLLEIAESGQFKGSVEIENADIAGRYDGQLTVHGRLTVRGTGRISGMVKYGELEIVAGGQIIGELQVVGSASSPSSGTSGFKSAAKFASSGDDDDDASHSSRKVANS